MSNGKDVICTGCGRTAFETGMYDPKDNPVEEDGTYADKKFVCDNCYFILTTHNLDIGNARILQKRARELVAGKLNSEFKTD